MKEKKEYRYFRIPNLPVDNVYAEKDGIKIMAEEINIKEYSDWKIKECLPERNNTEIKATGEGGIYEQGGQDGWNACIDQILLNKDKIK